MRYLLVFLFSVTSLFGQDYFTERYQPFDTTIPAPKDFLEYEIGSQHTRHDQIISYLEQIASLSSQAKIVYYGKTHEGRKLPLLIISSQENLSQLETIQKAHLAYAQGRISEEPNIPLIINLAYNVHGNEPSSSEAALLAAYTLSASQEDQIKSFRENAIIFIDPTINPDGRDRHTQWANMYKGTPLVADPMDAEHNEAWPRGRTNHYWFDLNRDWLLAINPESQGKLAWYHQWYPNVVTDFHEMGSQSTYFFEPMKPNGSLDPIMPKDNYVKLNDLFATYFAKGLDSIGSLYFTKEAFGLIGLNHEEYITSSEKYFRPNEVDYLLGNPKKALDNLGWKPETDFKELVKMMVNHDINEAKKEYTLLKEKLISPTWESSVDPG